MGWAAFSRPAALSVARVEWPYGALSALRDEKGGSSSGENKASTASGMAVVIDARVYSEGKKI
ncbi:MAG TPA: hypothetical protein ENI94_00650 [Gammaproteobacteria bacterium]|nr:hypothetical protein [Gammaproteobacteria bacterium]